MVCETLCTIVNTILCCTQKYKKAEDIDIKIENIQSKTEGTDIVKIIIEPEKNTSSKPSCISQAYVSQKPDSESLKKRSQNIVSTNNSKILGNYYIRFAKCKCGQQEQQNSSEDESKLQVMIVTDKHYCGNLSEVDEPHRHNVPEIDIIENPENPEESKRTTEASQSRRLPQPQLLVTSCTRNSQCRAGNSTTSTSYLPIKKQEPCKQDTINSYPLTSTKIDKTKNASKQSLIKYITRIFRHSAPEIKKK